MFLGSIVAAITPFKQGKIDFQSFSNLLHRGIIHGTEGLIIASPLGEGFSLNPTEYQDLLEASIKVVAGRIPVIATCYGSSTTACIDLITQAEMAGCSGVLVSAPFYRDLRQENLLKHFQHIYEHTHIPMIIAHDSYTGSKILPETLIKLMHIPTVVGIYDESLEKEQGLFLKAQIKKLKDEGKIPLTKPFTFLTNPASFLNFRADGVISGLGNVFPGLLKAFSKRQEDSCSSPFLSIFSKLQTMLEQDFEKPVPLKSLMHTLGLCKNELRLPFLPWEKTWSTQEESFLRELFDFKEEQFLKNQAIQAA